MNFLIKAITLTWLAAALICSYIGCMFFGFASLFSEAPWIYKVSPYCGFTIAICTIMAMIRVYKSNPKQYAIDVVNTIRGKLG